MKKLKEMPNSVQRTFGYGLHLAQTGERHPATKPLKGFAGGGILEIVEDYDGNAYRAIYTVKFSERVYVIHVFQKKSKSGISTPKPEIDLIKNRLKQICDIDKNR